MDFVKIENSSTPSFRIEYRGQYRPIRCWRQRMGRLHKKRSSPLRGRFQPNSSIDIPRNLPLSFGSRPVRRRKEAPPLQSNRQCQSRYCVSLLSSNSSGTRMRLLFQWLYIKSSPISCLAELGLTEYASKPYWVKGVYVIAFGYLVLLSGLMFIFYQQGRVQHHSTYGESKKETIQKSSIPQTEMENLKMKGPPGSESLKELPSFQGAVKNSEPSVQQEKFGRLEEIKTSRGAGAQSVKPESRTAVGSRPPVGPTGQTFTDPSHEKKSSGEETSNLEGRGKSTSDDRMEKQSQSPGVDDRTVSPGKFKQRRRNWAWQGDWLASAKTWR